MRGDDIPHDYPPGRDLAEWCRAMPADAATEIERLRRVEEDHKNVLRAALYNEPNGADLVNRLTTWALNQRSKR